MNDQVWNLRPRMTRRPPWGWTNQPTTYGPVVVKPTGEVRTFNLQEFYDWSSFQLLESPLGGLPTLEGIVTRDHKSVLHTAARYLGWERLLVERPSLRPITDMFVAWNRRVLATWGEIICYFVIGDDIGTSHGLLVSPEVWREWIRPEWQRLVDLANEYEVEVVFHSEGDLWPLLDDLVEMGIRYLHPVQPVGRMEQLVGESEYKGMGLLHDVPIWVVSSYEKEA